MFYHHWKSLNDADADDDDFVISLLQMSNYVIGLNLEMHRLNHLRIV